MGETDQESRLRRFLASYERLCKKYGLVIQGESIVCERFYSDGTDCLPDHLEILKQCGITK